MLRFVPHSEIDFTLWDSCVQNAAEHLIYAYAGYLEISTNGKWDAIIETGNGKYLSVFPLPYKKLPGCKFTYQPLHSQQLGLFTTAGSRYKNLPDYLTLIPKEYKKVYLQLNSANRISESELPAGFSVKSRNTFHLAINQPYEILSKNYSTGLQRHLKKAKKQVYQVTASEDISGLIGLFRKTRGSQLKNIKTKHYKLIEKQYVFLKKNNLATLLEIRQADELVAAALFLTQPGKLIFLFSAVSEKGKNTGTMPFLIDSVIRQEADSEAILDFEGGNIGTMRQFYSSFGANSVTYLSVSKNNLPWYYKWLLT